MNITQKVTGQTEPFCCVVLTTGWVLSMQMPMTCPVWICPCCQTPRILFHDQASLCQNHQPPVVLHAIFTRSFSSNNRNNKENYDDDNISIFYQKHTLQAPLSSLVINHPVPLLSEHGKVYLLKSAAPRTLSSWTGNWKLPLFYKSCLLLTCRFCFVNCTLTVN